MSARRKPGLDAIADATAKAAAALYVVRVGDVDRAALKPSEFAQIMGWPDVDAVYRLIRSGDIHVINEAPCGHHAIPTSELVRWQAMARPADRTA